MEKIKEYIKKLRYIFIINKHSILVHLFIFILSIISILIFSIFFDNTLPSANDPVVIDEPKVVVEPHYENISAAVMSESLAQYVQSLGGSYSISMVEISGDQRIVSYNDKQPSTSASTYKLYVAYSVLKRIEEGLWNWSDNFLGGQDVSSCFDDMIVNSDNNCAEAFLSKIGGAAVITEAHSIGCYDIVFSSVNYAKATSSDLALFLTKLEKGQILNQQSSRDRLIDAMKRNVYREGIPAASNGVVANKVGFIEAILNDAAIIYNPTGVYVLVIMTNHSSWEKIASITSKIEELRTQQVLVP